MKKKIALLLALLMLCLAVTGCSGSEEAENTQQPDTQEPTSQPAAEMDAELTALVNQIASTHSADPEALRDYVRNTIYYSSSWGGDDPVWYGFKEKNGNCYVHALCLNSLLRYHGYNTKLIWTTCRTHYWLLIELNGEWKHIDPTPSRLHGRYSLMSDDQRYETLKGRDWDRSAWPTCN